MIVFLYKEAYLSTNESNLLYLLLLFLFFEEILNDLPPIRGIVHQIDFILRASIPICQPIEAIVRRQKNFKDR